MKKILQSMLFVFLLFQFVNVSASEITIEQVIDALNNGSLAESFEEEGGSLTATYDEDSIDLVATSEGEEHIISFDLDGTIISKSIDTEAETALVDMIFILSVYDEIGQLHGYEAGELMQTISSDLVENYTLEVEGFEIVLQTETVGVMKIDFTKKVPLADFSNVYIEVEDFEGYEEYISGDGFASFEVGNVYFSKYGYDGEAVVVIGEKDNITSNTYNSLLSTIEVMFNDERVINYFKSNVPNLEKDKTFGGVTVKVNSSKFTKADKEELPYNAEGSGYEFIIVYIDNALTIKNAHKPVVTLQANANGSITVLPSLEEDAKCQVYRATSKSGKYSKVATIDSCLAGYTDKKALPGKTYYYKVRTVTESDNTTKYGLYSDIVSKKASLPAPTITVTSASKTSLSVKWDKVEGATGYQVYRATSKTGTYKLVKTTTSTSYKNTGLTTGKTYYYKVRAYKTVSSTKGYGSYSTVVSAVPKVGKPTITVSSSSYNSNKITWKKVTGASGYEVYLVKEDGTSTRLTRTTSTSYTHKSLTTGKEYTYKVRAYATVKGSRKYGSYSDVKIGIPVPSAPTFTINNKLNSGYLQIEINKVSGATGYSIFKCVGEEYVPLATVTELTYKDEDVTLGEEYSYKVVAYREVNSNVINGKESSIKAATVKPQVLKLSITNDAYNKQRITMISDEGVYADDNHKVYLYRATSKTGKYTLIYEGTDFEYVATGLSFNKTYYYKAVLERNEIKSENSLVVSKKTALTKPTVTAKVGSKSSIKLSWDKIAGASGYQVYRATSKTGTYKLLKTTTSTSYTNSSLTAGKTYYYKVRAYRTVSGKKVYGSYSTVVSEKPRVGVPKYTVERSTYNSNKVTITKVSGATGYAIYRSTAEDSGYELIKTTTSTTYTDKSLQTGTTYYYKVRAYSTVSGSKKYGDYSEVRSATPYLDGTKITFDSKNSMNSITFSFAKVSGAEGYEIYKMSETNIEPVKVADTKELTYTDSDVVLGTNYTYYVRAYRTVNDARVYSVEDIYNTKQVIPETPTVEVSKKTDTSQLVTVTIKEFDSEKINIKLYRKVNDGDFELVAEGEPGRGDIDYAAFDYTADDIVLGNTYTYKAYVVVDEVQSETSEEVIKYAAYDAPKGLELMVSSDDIKYITGIVIMEEEFDGVEVYRSSSKDGEYEAVGRFDDRIIEVKALWGKTYYYKARYYRVIGDVKVYSEYTEPMAYRHEVFPITQFPAVIEKGSSYKVTINEPFSFSLVSETSTKLTLKVSANISTYSSKARTVQVQVKFAPNQGDKDTKMYYLTYDIKLPKGTKNNWKVTDTVTIPKEYANYSILNVTIVEE